MRAVPQFGWDCSQGHRGIVSLEGIWYYTHLLSRTRVQIEEAASINRSTVMPRFAFRLTPWLLLLLFIPAAVLHAQTPRELLAEGERLLIEEDLQGARARFEQAARERNTMIAANIGIGRVLLEQERWAAAGDYFDKVAAVDPDNIAARFYKGIVQRELAKYRTINQHHHWTSAQEAFAWVIQKDSTFSDVLYQLALLQKYLDNYTTAVDLGTRQVRLKPTSIAARHNLFGLYRTYINHTPPANALTWLRARGTQIADYFVGETLRKQGKLDAADSVFSSLLAGPLTIPHQPVLLSRARILYARGEVDKAQEVFDRAVHEIEDGLDAAFLFDDSKYLMTDEELATWKRLRTAPEYQAFFQIFWDRRDPSPARPVNVRLAEHYRRILVAEKEYAYDGLRLWLTNPDQIGDFIYPGTYKLNKEFNDRGLVFIRQGEPTDQVPYVGGMEDFMTQFAKEDVFYMPATESGQTGSVTSESWRYREPRMDFHFILAGGANNWRLTPRVTNYGWLQQLEHWGHPYSLLANTARRLQETQEMKGLEAPRSSIAVQTEEQQRLEAADSSRVRPDRPINTYLLPRYNQLLLEYQDIQRELIERNKESATLALTTDRHTWAQEVQPVAMPYILASFRDGSGRTRVEVHFALPVGHLSKALKASAGNIDIEVGFSLHDTTWTKRAEVVEAKKVPATPDETAAMIDFFDAVVRPDSYSVSIYSRPRESKHEGAEKAGYRVRDFSQAGMDLSDLLLADYVGPAKGSRFDRGEYHLTPNPFGRFSTRQPVYVYFEVYDLKPGADGQTRWSVDYALIPSGAGRLELPILGAAEKPVLTLRVQRGGTEVSPREYAEVDVSSVPPGNYLLQVTVTDELAGTTQIRTRPVELYLYKK